MGDLIGEAMQMKSEKEAFDKSREEIVEMLYGRGIEGNKHNALYDAEVIKAIYDKIHCAG